MVETITAEMEAPPKTTQEQTNGNGSGPVNTATIETPANWQVQETNGNEAAEAQPVVSAPPETPTPAPEWQVFLSKKAEDKSTQPKQDASFTVENTRPVTISEGEGSAAYLGDLPLTTQMAEDLGEFKDANAAKSEMVPAPEKRPPETGMYALTREEIQQQLMEITTTKIYPKTAEKIAGIIEDFKEFRASLPLEVRENFYPLNSAADLMAEVPNIGMKRANAIAEKFGLVEAEKVEPKTPEDEWDFTEHHDDEYDFDEEVPVNSAVETNFDAADAHDVSYDFAPENSDQPAAESAPEVQPQSEHKGMKKWLTRVHDHFTQNGSSSKEFFTLVPPKNDYALEPASTGQEKDFSLVQTAIEKSGLSAAKKRILAGMVALSAAIGLRSAADEYQMTPQQINTIESKLAPLVETVPYEQSEWPSLHNAPLGERFPTVESTPTTPSIPPEITEESQPTDHAPIPDIAPQVAPPVTTAMETGVLGAPPLPAVEPQLNPVPQKDQLLETMAKYGTDAVPPVEAAVPPSVSPAEATSENTTQQSWKDFPLPEEKEAAFAVLESGVLYKEAQRFINDNKLEYNEAAVNALVHFFMRLSSRTKWTELPANARFQEIHSLLDLENISQDVKGVTLPDAAVIKLYEAFRTSDTITDATIKDIAEKMMNGQLKYSDLTNEQVRAMINYALGTN